MATREVTSKVTSAKIIRDGIRAGNDDATIVAACKEAFPHKKNIGALVKYYRKELAADAAKAAAAPATTEAPAAEGDAPAATDEAPKSAKSGKGKK